jgi:hypothetical protein
MSYDNFVATHKLINPCPIALEPIRCPNSKTKLPAGDSSSAASFLLGIGISQAATGWIGDGVYQRWIYPILCFLMAIVCIWIGYQAIAPPSYDAPNDSTTT